MYYDFLLMNILGSISIVTIIERERERERERKSQSQFHFYVIDRKG
jgi:hypothetical protein